MHQMMMAYCTGIVMLLCFSVRTCII